MCTADVALRSAAEHSLSVYLPENAVFMAERLVAMQPSEANRRLLARSHLRAGKPACAKIALKNCKEMDSRYLYAVVCMELGQHREAEIALTPKSSLPGVNTFAGIDSYGEHVPGSAAGVHLLGVIAQRTARHDLAVQLYRRALQLNPFLWVAFEGIAMLCNLETTATPYPSISDGEALAMLQAQPRVDSAGGNDDVFDERLSSRQNMRAESASVSASGNAWPSPPTLAATTLSFTPMLSTNAPLRERRDMNELNENMPRVGVPSGAEENAHGAADEVWTPTPTHSSLSSTATKNLPPTVAPSRRRRSIRTSLSRSSKLSFGCLPSPKHTLGAHEATPSPAASDPTAAPLTSPPARRSESPAAVYADGCVHLLGKMAAALSALSCYRCEEAIVLFNSLPPEQVDTGYVLSCIGRAYMEIGDYTAAEGKFEEAQVVDPARMDQLVEYYSTILWHQKKEAELASLARRAVDADRHSAASWCAAGNCFSLQRDADTALRFFKRAAQVDPCSAYAHTLMGHEYMLKEDLDSAKAAYYEALAIDPRHYNAWYGVGHVYQKQENYEMAEKHFRAALRVHPRRATLHYHLACALAEAGATDDALAALDRALELEPGNPVVSFERAKVLAMTENVEEAISELQTLCDNLPKEPAVHFELGRLQKMVGDVNGALQNFSLALNLDPKARVYRKALDSLDSIDEEEV